jgi:hypothetical protein
VLLYASCVDTVLVIFSALLGLAMLIILGILAAPMFYVLLHRHD